MYLFLLAEGSLGSKLVHTFILVTTLTLSLPRTERDVAKDVGCEAAVVAVKRWQLGQRPKCVAC